MLMIREFIKRINEQSEDVFGVGARKSLSVFSVFSVLAVLIPVLFLLLLLIYKIF